MESKTFHFFRRRRKCSNVYLVCLTTFSRLDPSFIGRKTLILTLRRNCILQTIESRFYCQDFDGKVTVHLIFFVKSHSKCIVCPWSSTVRGTNHFFYVYFTPKPLNGTLKFNHPIHDQPLNSSQPVTSQFPSRFKSFLNKRKSDKR